MLELTLNQVSKHFSAKKAVNGISTRLTSGVYGLLGANGAGKTTLMRMICGILNPTSGEIQMNGQEISSMGEHYRDMLGYLPQDFGYYPDFSAEEFLWYVGSLKGLTLPAAKSKARELLRTVALSEVARKKIRTFSGGMKQRLGIAQAMLNDPRVLVLDEPTAGLDPKERVRFRNLIANLARDKIVILSTHIVSDVEYIADQILVMKQGGLLMTGTVEQLTTTMEGCVWSCHIPAREAEEWNARYCVSNLRHEGNQVELRIVSTVKPAHHALLVAPTLEDFYLHHFQDEQVAVTDEEKERA
ncbi:ABC-type multidrug transport system ATPase subunit [Paenibacillus forsythiae]|uniref:ABC-type multidrug transport system ATPase subunit n=1 Tax=Paenibacillus forsythiae TaxID=365616 RepID=A0ABU3H1E7_9BACL|nr:ABC transporter ATP-binding protein [Paenibacillus forsythiae]MDT3424639.1 ABC-type multidrug transport system ATPase subunit [Paenibacillus forsythiae]